MNEIADETQADVIVARRDNGQGSLFPHPSNPNRDDRLKWVGKIDAGLTSSGRRRRVKVVGKTKAATRSALNRKIEEIRAQGPSAVVGRVPTVKAYAEKYLHMKRDTLRPKAYAAAASAINPWVIPTIGHVRLDALTPDHIRAVAKAQLDAGRKSGTALATHRQLMAMIRFAVVDGGHMVPTRTLMTKPPKAGESDRLAFSVVEARACLEVAAALPHGVRWLLAILYGLRQGEALGLRWADLDLDAGTMSISWQLQEIAYIDRKNKALGCRLPADYVTDPKRGKVNAIQLVGTWWLVDTKTESGHRVLPLHPQIVKALKVWRAECPTNDHDLVFPTAQGRPTPTKTDRAEWSAIQKAAQVQHPNGRPYMVHECRHTTATRLAAKNASSKVSAGTLGQAKLVETYVHEDLVAKGLVLNAVAKELLPSKPRKGAVS